MPRTTSTSNPPCEGCLCYADEVGRHFLRPVPKEFPSHALERAESRCEEERLCWCRASDDSERCVLRSIGFGKTPGVNGFMFFHLKRHQSRRICGMKDPTVRLWAEHHYFTAVGN